MKINFAPTPEDIAIISKLDRKDPYIWLAVWGGCGFMRPAPGTWGSAGAIPVGVILYMIAGNAALLFAIAAVVYFGLKAIEKFQQQTNTNDHSMIVVDEVAGQWIALLATGMQPLLVLAAFLFFRLFDITKIWPVSWCEQKLPGARGVMADDLAAGAYAFICVMGLRYAGFG